MKECNKVFLFLLIMVNISMFFTFPSSAVEFPVSDNSVNSIDVLQWKYKTVNGTVYKRLYNTTTQQWITEWEQIS